MKLNKAYLLSLVLLVASSGCGNYSFTGASIPDDVKTISITQFFNDSGGGPPNMGQFFTEELRDQFQRNTNLELIQRQGDLQFEGAITRYEIRPQSIASSGNSLQSDQSGLMRLTITVQTTFTNLKREEDNFNRPFTFFADYDPQANTLAQVESELIDEIFEQIIQDIFLASVAQW